MSLSTHTATIILLPPIYISVRFEAQPGGAFGGNRGARPVPPEKGVFPLDHMHSCDQDLRSSLKFSTVCRAGGQTLKILIETEVARLMLMNSERRL